MEKREIGQRIRAMRKQKNVERKTLAAALRTDVSYITKIEKGLANFTIEKLLRISGTLGVPPYDLFAKEHLVPVSEAEQEPIIQINAPGGAFEGIRCLGSPVSLGPGYNMDEAETRGFLPISKAELPVGYKSMKDRVVCFPTAGLSMAPTIMPNSHVVVDRYVPAEWAVPGGIFAFLLPSGDVTIKRLIKRTDGSVIIDADNQDPRERVGEGSAKDFPMVLQLREDVSIIRGRVIWIFNRLVPVNKG